MATEWESSLALDRRSRTFGDRVTGERAPNKPMKLTVAGGARSLSARRWLDTARHRALSPGESCSAI